LGAELLYKLSFGEMPPSAADNEEGCPSGMRFPDTAIAHANMRKSAPKSLLQRHDAREYAKDSVDAIVMHYPYIVRQAAGNANHW
ncbi:hypothetical protein MJN51_39745, partial [Salmonella enterica subsp. enterica serovar Kentucky]|nr:hypothetical protein [Salmonella enterica subsp. enterica serovar Kentucky]